LDHFISFFLGFFILDLGFHILGALVESISFDESFMAKVLHEDLRMISNLLMFTDPHMAFVMLALCYP
jgi:hypothetical protein